MNLFICNNAFQIIIATKIYLSTFYEENAVLIMADDISEYEILYQNIVESNIFNKVILIRSARCILEKKNMKYKLKRLKCEFLGCTVIEEVFQSIALENCNHIFVNGPRCYAECIYYSTLKKNKNVKLSLFEEGYSTYTNLYKKALFSFSLPERIIRAVSKNIFQHSHISDDATDLYLLKPGLLSWKAPFTIREIKSTLNNGSFETLISSMMGIKRINITNQYNYIFLEEAFWLDYNEFFDLELVKVIYSVLNNKNSLAIKLHPRSMRNRFMELGCDIIRSYGIPWEILELNIYKQCKLITMSSGAALSSRLLFGRNVDIILLYKCVNEDSHMSDPSVLLWFEKFIKEYPNNIYVPESINELVQLLYSFEGKKYESNTICYNSSGI